MCSFQGIWSTGDSWLHCENWVCAKKGSDIWARRLPFRPPRMARRSPKHRKVKSIARPGKGEDYHLKRRGRTINRAVRLYYSRPSGMSADSRQPQILGDRFHRLNAERDVLFQVDSHVGGAVDDVVAIYAAREGFVLHLL